MKTPIIIALSLVGVLGTAGAAMAVNAGTLAGFSQSNLGNAPTSLTTPTGTPSATPTPSDDATENATPEPGEHATPEPGDDNTKSTTGTTTKSGSDDADEHTTAPVPTVPSPSPTHHDDDGGSDDSHSGGGHGSDD